MVQALPGCAVGTRQRITAKVGPATATVLVVDDNPVDRYLVGNLLEKHPGWKVAYAGNGREALDLLSREQPDVVLTDLLMEEMDGLTLVEEVNAKHPQVPVILMTAHGSEEMALQAMRAGASSYVPKKSLHFELMPCVEQVTAASKESQQRQRLHHHLARLEYGFELENDPALVRPVLAQVEEDMNHLQLLEGSRVRLKVALEEALLTALYHVNLELERGQRPQETTTRSKVIEERRHQQQYKDRRLQFGAQFSRDAATFRIRAEGPPAELAALAAAVQPSQLSLTGNRGPMLIQTFMDEFRFDEKDNTLTLVKRVRTAQPERS